MSIDDRQRWDAKYRDKPVAVELAPDDWLTEQVAGLKPGRALELACGLGHNSIWLAQKGWRVDAVDVSSVGLEHARALALHSGATVNWIAADLKDFIPEAEAYDLVLVFRFLDRLHLPVLIERSLGEGGLLLYETFTTSHLARPGSHMKNPAFALKQGELLRMFPRLETLAYADCSLPDRDVARLVARKKIIAPASGAASAPR